MLDSEEQTQMLRELARRLEMVAATLEVCARDAAYGGNPSKCDGRRGELVELMRDLRDKLKSC